MLAHYGGNMFYLQNPLRILLVVVAIFATTAGTAQQPVPKKALPDFIFSNDYYSATCTDKKKGECEKLIELLKSFQRPREKITPKQWNEHIRSA